MQRHALSRHYEPSAALDWIVRAIHQHGSVFNLCQLSADADSAFVDVAALMSDVYEDHKDEDGFLYITYSGENTFGQ